MNGSRILWGALAVALGLAWGVHDPQTGLIWGVGCLLGWMLVHFRFGFAAPFRRLIQERDARAIDPLAAVIVALVLGSAVLLVLPEPLTLDLKFTRAPLSFSLVGGAFLFGVGMQMAGRCGSGTLVSAPRGGGGFGLTLMALIAGVFLGSLLRPGIEAVSPSIPPQVLTDSWLPWQAVIIQLLLLTLLLVAINLCCGARFWSRSSAVVDQPRWDAIKPALWIAVAILLMLVVSGEPWKVLWGLALTGAHAAKLLGWDPATSAFWAAPTRVALLSSHWNWIRHDAVVVDLALVYGALASQAWERPPAGRSPSKVERGLSQPQAFYSFRFVAAGLLMGFGGFLSYGCNVSSFLGGIQGFSLHGWLWVIAAFVGSWTWLTVEKRFKPSQSH